MSFDAAGAFTCRGPFGKKLLNQGLILTYGERVRAERMLCDSEESGMTCTNTLSGHGFFISRGNYRLF